MTTSNSKMASTTTDVNRVMYSNSLTKKFYGGTWSVDNVPITKALKSGAQTCFIVNSSPANHPGSHWTTVWIGAKKKGRNRELEHFCSYGLPPPLTLHRLLLRNQKGYKRSEKQLQKSYSVLCGYYCMLFLMCKCRGLETEKFLQCFTKNQSINDHIVVNACKRISLY